MTGLPEDLQALLEAERDIDAPEPEVRESLLARLQPLLIVPAALAAGASSAASGAEASGNAVGFFNAKVGAAVVSAALIGGGVGVAGHAYLAPPAPRPVAAQTAPSLAPTDARPRPIEPAPSVTPQPTVAAPSASAPASSAVRSKERPSSSGSLRAERLLIEAASAALMRGDPDAASIALRQHAQRFPNGALTEEREALLARARAAARNPR